MDEFDHDLKPDETLVVPVIAEELYAGVRRVPTGGVRINKRVSEREEVIDQPLRRENVQVRRVVRNEVVSGPLPVRHEGETMIVPVVKEMLKVEKQFVLTEELHITKQVFDERHAETMILKQEHAEVERIDAAGNSTGPFEVVAPVARVASEEPSNRDSVFGAARKVPVRRNRILPNR